MMRMAQWLLTALPEEAAGDLLEEAASRGRGWLLWQAVRSTLWGIAESYRRGEFLHALLASTAGVLVPLLALDRLWAYIYSQVPLRDGLLREPWMLLVNVLLASVLSFAMRRNAWSAFMLPAAGAAAWWLGMAEAGLSYGLPLIGACALLGRYRR